MKISKKYFVDFLASLFLLQGLLSFKQSPVVSSPVNQRLIEQSNVFQSYVLDSLRGYIATNAETSKIQNAFLKSRRLYKQLEWVTEYFMFTNCKYVNGPPVAEAEPLTFIITPPGGLQVLETDIFPNYNHSKRNVLLEEIDKMLRRSAGFETYFNKVPVANWQLFDAAKLEVFRIESLGITGYDNPATLRSMEESAQALESLRLSMASVLTEDRFEQTNTLFLESIDYLRKNKDFDTFDRLTFIRSFANPLTRSIDQLQQQLGIKTVKYNRLLNQSATTLFDKNAFNAWSYAPEIDTSNLQLREALGKKLFFEPLLSENKIRSCATCHNPNQAYTDGLRVNTSLIDGSDLPRNTPSLLNAALQTEMFADMRSESLEDQALEVIHSKTEMRGNIQKALQEMCRDSSYQRYFKLIFGKASVDTMDIVTCLDDYVRTLTSLNSPFDQYMRGDSKSYNKSAQRGFNLFMGKAKCATCHFMPLFNGVVPPKFISQDVEVLGVPDYRDTTKIDPDLGYYNYISQGIYASPFQQDFKYAFKTPTVRNAALTAPYMHNGIFKNLDELLSFYNDGGGLGRGLVVPNQTLDSAKLNLTTVELSDLKAFIISLSDSHY